MSAKHTPGPWVAKFEEAYYVTGPDLGRVAMMMNLKGAYGLAGRRSGEESAANASLIAAAPDLLEALSAVRDRFFPASQPERDRDLLWEPVNAAIAKATGQKGGA